MSAHTGGADTVVRGFAAGGRDLVRKLAVVGDAGHHQRTRAQSLSNPANEFPRKRAISERQ